MLIWDDILVRSWNSNTGAAGASCDGGFVPPGFEGLHVFDVSNPADPDLIASVDPVQGSHTASLVPDLANDRCWSTTPRRAPRTRGSTSWRSP